MRLKQKAISLLLSAALIISTVPQTVFAAGTDEQDSGAVIGASSLCENHMAHDEDCGYVEGTEGSPCTHEHGEECYTTVTSCTHTHTEGCYPVLDNSVSGDTATPSEAAEPTECTHVCSEESGCVTKELNCQHEHDEACGYSPAVDGSPCTHVCELCGLTEITSWSWVDELEVIDPENSVLALPGTSEETPALFGDITALLPSEITAATGDGVETVTLDGWACQEYPEAGAYTGSYAFTANLPEGFTLAADAPALTVTVELGGAAMLVEGAAHSHPICGANCLHTDGVQHNESVTWTAWDGKSNITCNNGVAYLYLSDNVKSTNSYWNISGADTIYLCLNGKTVTFGGYGANVNGDAIKLSGTSSLILCDCVGDGKIQLGTKGIDSQLSGIYVGEGCSLMMYGGTISGFNKSGVHVGGTNATNGVFYMYGGNITKNAASDAGSGGVRVDSAANFDMYGGCISGNKGGFFGGGVYNGGIFRMHGGEIKDNTVTGTYDSSILAGGGGVYNDSIGVFEMSGGCISGNTVTKGKADRCGSGVFCALNMKLSGSPVIKGNTRKAGGNKIVDDNLLLLAYFSKITIDGPLENNAQIGVYVRNGIPEAGKPRTITDVSNADYSAYFFSDASYWTIAGGMSDAGQVVQLAVPAAHAHEWKYALKENTQDSIVAYCSTAGDCEFGRNGGTLTIQAPENLVYDGQAKPAKLVASDYWERVTGTSGISISYGKYYNTAWNTMDGVPTEAGRYLASIKVGNVTAFVSYDITDASSGKSDPTYTAPTAKNGLTYNGQPQELINAGSATGGEMQYKLTEEGAYSASIPKATDAGVYTVFYKVVGNDGYNDVAEQSMTAYIGMAVLGGTPTFTPITGAGRTLADVELTAPADWPAGTFQWLDGDAVLANDTPITQGTSYYWKFVPDAAYNYYSLGQYIVLWADDGGGGSEHTHSYGADWMTDSPGHWHECSCGDKKDFAAHTPGAAATETTPQTCTVCGYVIKPATGGSTGGGNDYIPPSGGSSGGGDSGNTGTKPGTDEPQNPGTKPGTDEPQNPDTDEPQNPDTGDKLTVPISGEQNTIQAKATVTGKTATIEDVDLSTLDSVIGGHVKTGVVTIDFSRLDIELGTVKIPADVVEKIAGAVNKPGNDAESLHVVFPGGLSIEFDRAALMGEAEQVKGRDVAISIKPAHDSTLNSSQKKAVGSRTAYHISVTSGGVHISDLGGNVMLHAPYELLPGEKAGGVTVYYVDDSGNKDACETSYDSAKKCVNWKTSHLSVYMIGYEEKTNPDTSGTPGEEIPTSPETGDTTPAYVTYTVQKGDTLRAISRKYGCTVADIVAANSGLIKNLNLILAGWQLQIPQGEKAGTGTPDTALPEDKETGVYIVKRGDTLWAISRKYGCTVAAIVALNGELIDAPDSISAGWELKIPQG